MNEVGDNTHPPVEARRFFWLSAALLIAAFIQFYNAYRAPVIARDGIRFIQIAHELHRPRAAFSYFAQHPGYPASMYFAHAMIGMFSDEATIESWVCAARITSGLYGLLCILVVWLFTRRLAGQCAADVAAMIVSRYSRVRTTQADALSDSGHLFFYLLATWCLCEAVSGKSLWWYCSAGCSSGLAYWIRPEGWSIALVGGLYLAVQIIRSTSHMRRRFVVGLMLLLATTIVTSGPYVALSGKLTDKVRRKENLIKFQAHLNRQSKTPAATATAAPDLHKTGLPTTTDGFCRILTAAVGELLKNILDTFQALLVPAACALIFYDKRRFPAGSGPILGGLAGLHALLLIGVYFTGGYISERHLLPIVGLSMPLVAVGIIGIAETVRAWVSQRLIPRLSRYTDGQAVAFATLLLFVAFAPQVLRVSHPQFQPDAVAARWIKQRYSAQQLLISNSPYLPFYAELTPRCGRVVETHEDFAQELAKHPHEKILVVLQRKRRQSQGPPDRELHCPSHAAILKFAADCKYRSAVHETLVFECQPSPRQALHRSPDSLRR